MSVEHDYFGIVEDDGSGGLRWSDTVDVGSDSVEIDLSADDAAAVSAQALDSAAAVIRALDGLDARARDALIAQLSDRESATTQYIDQSVDEMGENLLDALVHNSGDIPMDVLRSLQLVHVGLFPERDDDDDPFAVFDYSLDPDQTNAVLVVSFDDRGDVVAVETDAVDG